MINKKVVEFRINWTSKRLKLKPPPKCDKDKSQIEVYENVKKRFRHLAQVMSFLYKMYNENRDLYGDGFLAFVGDSVVKGWPNIRLDFSSEEKYTTGVKGKEEHWTPISFFRDLFAQENLKEDDFYDALVYFYRVVYISKDENNSLDKKFKTTRPIYAYDELEISIHEKELWNSIYGSVDSEIKKLL